MHIDLYILNPYTMAWSADDAIHWMNVLFDSHLDTLQSEKKIESSAHNVHKPTFTNKLT